MNDDADNLEGANRALAADVALLQAALADLYAQVHEFVASTGIESDFYTGAAFAALAKTGAPNYKWPFSQTAAEEAIARLFSKA
jgi:hypothetical protein